MSADSLITAGLSCCPRREPIAELPDAHLRVPLCELIEHPSDGLSGDTLLALVELRNWELYVEQGRRLGEAMARLHSVPVGPIR